MTANTKPAAKSAAKRKELAANVYVGGVLYPAGSIPPEDVAEQIDNPKAWGEPASDD